MKSKNNLTMLPANTTKAEELSLQTSAEAGNNSPSDSNKIIERQPIEGTPFTVISTNEKHFLSMGNWRLSEGFNNKTELRKWMNKNQWNITVQICDIITRLVIQDANNIQEQKNTNL